MAGGMDKELSDEQIDRALEFINSKATTEDDDCQFCGSTENIISKYLWRLTAPAFTSTERILPLIVTSCFNCGHVRFFNAYVAGVIPFPREEDNIQDYEGHDGQAR